MQLHTTHDTLRTGQPLAEASGAVILLHGRGSSADEIAGLARSFKGMPLAFIAPNATNNTWYPQRFFVPLAHNEPWLTSALGVIDQLVAEVQAAGIPSDRIGIAGFSQGACLTLEYAARHPRRYGFIAGLSGGLIGPLDTKRPPTDLKQTPTLVACAENDAHIPLEFVEKSAVTLGALNAEVTKQIYRGSAHTVFPEEIAWLRERAGALK
ncbi:MAG: dienelactone hydrolase family protein [Nibricoccus sp.]